MNQKLSINLLNLILSISDALDLASPEISLHQLRTSFIAWEMGKAAKLPSSNMDHLFIASLLHDIGALSLENKIDIHQGAVADLELHAQLGDRILRHVPMFESSAEIVRFHHTQWEVIKGRTSESQVNSSQILFLADVLERSIDRNTYILHQVDELLLKINSLSGTGLDPEIVHLFRSIAVREEFWFTLVSPRLYSVLLRNGPSRVMEVDLAFLLNFSELFRNIIDFRSRITATHSIGVATAASAISRLKGMDETETGLLEVAGNLHDLGKMVIPNSILDKPGKLSKEETAIMRQHAYFTYTILNSFGGISMIAEWAGFHHEHLDGSGYPFHISVEKLDIGSRIMAIADIFTALSEERVYHKDMSQQKILSTLRSLCAMNFLDETIFNVLESNYDEVFTLTQKKQNEAKEYYAREFAYS